MESGSTIRNAQTPLSGSLAASLLTKGERSSGEAGQRDLDAALQLLVNRAQYITGATGAAIALRRPGSKDMLCRGSIGANAPELGALLSTEFGLSGESVRTKQALRCDDTGQDARVDGEICRQLGISSVIVVPVLDDDQVLGVFELFSDTPNAFGDRDLSVVKRLSEMVETAIRMAEAQSLPVPKKVRAAAVGAGVSAVQEAKLATPAAHGASASTIASSTAPALPGAKKAILWSAPVETDQESVNPSDTDQSLIPPVMRDLRKCVACGFPISAGRMLCVECEEKKWRGQLRSQTSRSSVAGVPSAARPTASSAPAAVAKAPAPADAKAISGSSPVAEVPSIISPKKGEPTSSESSTPVLNQQEVAAPSPVSASTVVVPEFTLSAAIEPSQSWVARNKYILIALLAIAAAGSAIFFLR